MAGEKSARNWQSGKARGFDAFDAKAEVLAILAAAGAPVANLQVMGEAGEAYHPGQSGTLRLGPKTIVARYGVLHPRLAKVFDLTGTVVAAEIMLDAIPAKKKTGPSTSLRTGFMRPVFLAARAAGGDARLRLPGAREHRSRDAGARGARGRTRRASSKRGCSMCSQALACPRGRRAWRSK